MSKLAHCNSSEQELLKLAPIWAFLLVAKADGKMDEAEYKQFLGDLGHVLKNAKDGNGVSYEDMEIVTEIFGLVAKEFDVLSMNVQKHPLSPLEGIRKVSSIIDSLMSKAESELFRRSLVNIASNVANSSGGFGFLNNSISKVEATAINNIKVILRV